MHDVRVSDRLTDRQSDIPKTTEDADGTERLNTHLGCACDRRSVHKMTTHTHLMWCDMMCCVCVVCRCRFAVCTTGPGPHHLQNLWRSCCYLGKRASMPVEIMRRSHVRYACVCTLHMCVCRTGLIALIKPNAPENMIEMKSSGTYGGDNSMAQRWRI